MRRHWHIMRLTSTATLTALLWCGQVASAPAAEAESQPGRVNDGLQALYDFASDEGNEVRDRSGAKPPTNLKIENPQAVQRTAGGLEVQGPTVIRTDEPPARFIDAIRKSGALTIEAWLQPAKTDQSGPARIVTLSRDANERNVTLGQDGRKFDVRLRTTKTSTNGLPSLASKDKAVTSKLTHVVYTRQRKGRVRLYVNGQKQAEKTIAGDLSNWNKGFRLALANELSGGRPWLGTYRLVAIYNRELSSAEVLQNYRAGADGESTSAPPELARTEMRSRMFETGIAPLLAKHCLECHDTPSREGGLDLSRKVAAFAGGENGPAIVSGKSADSLLWQRVASDEMPAERDPLSAEEKNLLRKWLDEGAAWSLEVVDPAVYAHGDLGSQMFVQRLTVPEYIETVRTALGVDVSAQARELLPRDLRADGFSNTSYNLQVDLDHVEAYARLAEIIADRLEIQKLARRYTKSRELTDENITKVIAPVGLKLLRSPLSDDDLRVYCGVSTSVAGSGGTFEEALQFVFETMLQSPRFLYRIEDQQGDGSATPVSDYELASRLSYILWGGPPDDELFKAAADGQLEGDVLRVQVQRMLDDPRAIARSRQFLAEWLNLGRLDNLRPSAELFPDWQPSLAQDMREETLAFFEEIVWQQQRPLADLVNAQVTFVTPRLAQHYGLRLDKPSASGNAGELMKYDLSSQPARGGLLTQGSILTVGGDEASMVTRGLFVLNELLRGVVRDPPPCVDTTPIPTKAGLTLRGIAEARLANQACQGCHIRFEPLSFGLEKFDGLGTFHEKDEHGNTLREDGTLLVPGAAEPVAYQTAAELMDLLAGSERVKESLTWKVTQFALGRPLGAGDAPVMADIHRQAQQNGGTWRGLMSAIVTSDLVRLTRTEGE